MQADRTQRWMPERAGNGADHGEPETLIQPDCRCVRGRDSVELHASEPATPCPVQQIFAQRLADTSTTCFWRDHEVSAGDMRTRGAGYALPLLGSGLPSGVSGARSGRPLPCARSGHSRAGRRSSLIERERTFLRECPVHAEEGGCQSTVGFRIAPLAGFYRLFTTVRGLSGQAPLSPQREVHAAAGRSCERCRIGAYCRAPRK